ncbi:MAG: hypothetical protein VX519_06975 [Myxococcota bacterium]|nr:hypothetical protein [Myxococcota bacterium]
MKALRNTLCAAVGLAFLAGPGQAEASEVYVSLQGSSSEHTILLSSLNEGFYLHFNDLEVIAHDDGCATTACIRNSAKRRRASHYMVTDYTVAASMHRLDIYVYSTKTDQLVVDKQMYSSALPALASKLKHQLPALIQGSIHMAPPSTVTAPIAEVRSPGRVLGGGLGADSSAKTAGVSAKPKKEKKAKEPKAKKRDTPKAEKPVAAKKAPRDKPPINFARLGKLTLGAGASAFGVLQLLDAKDELALAREDLTQYNEASTDAAAEPFGIAYQQHIQATAIKGALGLALVGTGTTLVVKNISVSATPTGVVFSGTW